MTLALVSLLILCGCLLAWGMVRHERKRQQRNNDFLRRLYQSQPPPRSQFQHELRHRLLGESTTGSLPADGPNTSGLKPEPSPGANPDGTPEPLATTGGAWGFSNLTVSGLDTRGRVQTIGLTPLSTPAQPGEPTSTAADGSSGPVSPSDHSYREVLGGDAS